MLKIEIENFKKKYPLFELEDFLVDFEEGVTREGLSIKYNIGEMPLRMFVSSLGLDWVKSRRYASLKEFRYRFGLESDVNTTSIVRELENDIQILQQKNRRLYQSLTLARDENNVLRKESRDEVRSSTLEDIVIEGIKEDLNKIVLPETAFNILHRGERNKADKQPFALLSDLHYNEMIEGKYIENYNEFDNNICLEGIDKVLTEVQEYGGNTLRVYLAGDLLSGIIHGLDVKGQVPVTSSVVELAFFLSDRLTKLCRQYEKVKVMMVNGNHSRLYGKPVLDLKAFDFEHLLYELMRTQIKADNIELQYSYSTYLIDNVGTEADPKYVGLFHGDNKSFNPTVESNILKQFGIFDELFKVRVVTLMSGHTHKAVFTTSPRGGSILVNGCASGSNQFGFNANFLPIQPYQWIGTISKEGYIEQQKCIRLR